MSISEKQQNILNFLDVYFLQKFENLQFWKINRWFWKFHLKSDEYN